MKIFALSVITCTQDCASSGAPRTIWLALIHISQAEFEGIGHVMATSWGYKQEGTDGDDLDNWGICCVYAMSNNFREEHP